MKKKTLCILSCLISSNGFSQDMDCKPQFSRASCPTEIVKKLQEDFVIEELKSKGILTTIPGIDMHLVNYGLLAEELVNAGNSKKEAVFVVRNVKAAFDILELNRIKRKNLTEILDSMGVLNRDTISGSTICM
jgi:hypothetical protein